MNLDRFSRHVLLPEVGLEGQRLLAASRVLVIGAGGLGAPVALYLAAAGVGTLRVVDPDRVEASNLQRQVLFGERDLDRLKVDALAERLGRDHPGIQIEAVAECFDESSALALAAGCDLILDGSDNFATRILASDTSTRLGVPLVHAAADRFEGLVGIFDATRGSCYRCLQPHPPRNPVQNCATAGVLGPVVGVLGSLQATLALQFLVSRGDPNHPLCPEFGRLSLLDLRGSWNVSSVRVPRRTDCPSCSKEKWNQDQPGGSSISASELRQLLGRSSHEVLLIDLRPEPEWQLQHVPGSICWPLERFQSGAFPNIESRHQQAVLYCHSGVLSETAIELFETHRPPPEATVTPLPIRSLLGGFRAWGRQ